MRILLICTWFPPDTAVAAVRPYMFAKYLTKFGHEVTVLRSGLLYSKPDGSYPVEKRTFRVISTHGPDSPSERYERGDWKESPAHSHPVRHYLKRRVFKILPFLSSLYDTFKRNRSAVRHMRMAYARYCFHKKTLDTMKEEQYDIIFSTYGELENVFAGQYAAKLFRAKLIMDFRDPIVQPYQNSALWNLSLRSVQKRAVEQADICTVVSYGYAEALRYPSVQTPLIVLHNGFEEADSGRIVAQPDPSCLRICYTGYLYALQMDAFRTLAGAMRTLTVELGRKHSKFLYAGPHSQRVRETFDDAGIAEVLEDHGYVSREEAQAIQEKSDIFLVMAWKTRKADGILPGKFYEGIRARKPILAVVAGDRSGHDLYMMNEQYHYGFCCELARQGDHHRELKEYLEGEYQKKFANGGNTRVEVNPTLVDAFRYDHLSRKLEDICKNLTQN